MNSEGFMAAYIVGAQKAGTTSLYDWLAQHPDVFAPEQAKDFPLFSGDEDGFRGRLSRMQRLYAGTAARVRRVSIGAEANLVYSRYGIERLASTFPDCRVIFLVRRPDKRCFSAWRYARERGLDDRDFAEAIDAELSGETFPVDSYEGRQMNYIDHSKYAEQLAALRSRFQEDNILVLTFEGLRDMPESTMGTVCDFLGLRRDIAWDFTTSNKTAGRSRSRVLNRLLYRQRNSPIFSVIRSVMPDTIRTKIRKKIVTWNRTNIVTEPIMADPEAMERLRIALATDFKLHEDTVARNNAYLNEWYSLPRK